MSRRTILKLLQENEGQFVSGERISEEMGITRAAIWKSIDALRKEGYEIESKTKLGYRLLASPDKATAENVGARISTEIVGRSIVYFESIDSTNNYAKQAALQGGEDGLVVIANEQTGGRGRSGRSFQSPPDKGLYLTALLCPKAAPAEVLSVTALAAVAVCNAVERTCGVRPGIKWTNDLILNGKKLTGILTEMGVEGESGALQYVVIGIGVNANHEKSDFSDEVAEMATSLRMELGHPVSRAALAAALIEELDALYACLGGDLSGYLEQYREDCVTLGKQVRILGSGAERTGEAVGIDDSFGLIVRREDGTLETIRSGEVSVRGLYGYV